MSVDRGTYGSKIHFITERTGLPRPPSPVSTVKPRSPSGQATKSVKQRDVMDDRIDLAELLSRYADIADMKEFTHLPSRICTDPLTVDFEAVTGMPAVTASLRDCVELLRTTLAPFAATHHAITGHVVTIDGDSATIHAHVRAEHWLPVELVGDGPDRWLVVGFYDTEAVRTPKGWRISRFKLTVTHQENPQLASLAQAAEQARRPQA